MKKMNVVKRIVAVMLMVILGVTAVSENVVYAAEDVQEIEVSKTALEEEGEEIVTEEALEVSSMEEIDETNEIVGGTEQVDVTETEGTYDCVEMTDVEEILEATETDAEIWTDEEDVDADIEEDVRSTVTSNMKSECLPYYYANCELADSVVMGGTEYKDAIKFYLRNDDIRAGFNLNGIYKTISFSVGHIDGETAGASDIVMKIYRDGEEGESCSLNNNDIPRELTYSVDGTRQFEIVFECFVGWGSSDSKFGIGAINFSKEGSDTCIGKVVKSNMKEQNRTPYYGKNYELKDSVVMGGTEYKDAIKFYLRNDDIRAGFNLNGIYKTISFSVGHIDGETAGASDIVMKIYRDGEEGESCSLNNNDIPRELTYSVDGTRQFEIVFECSVGWSSSDSKFGIGALNFSKEAIENPVTVSDFSIDITKEGTANQPLTVSGSITLSEYKENLSELLQDAVSNIQWTSSDESIAKVTNCTITNIDSASRSAVLQITIMPYKTGTARITGKTSNNKTSSCEITIKSETLEPTEIISDFSIDSIENAGTPNGKIEAIGRLTLCDGVKASQKQIQEEVSKIVWRSSDPYIAQATVGGQISINGTQVQFPIQISCYKTGTVTITGRTSNNLTADCEVTVNEGMDDEKDIIARFSIDSLNDIAQANSCVETIGRFTLYTGVEASEKRIKNEVSNIRWTSSDNTIAEVTGCGQASINGTQVQFPIQINCYKAGTTTIRGRLSNGGSRSVQITVEEKSGTGELEKPTNVITNFNISEINEDSAKANSTIEIYGELILYENSFIDETYLQRDVNNIEWTSSDKTIAEVTGCGKISIDERRVKFPIRISCYKVGQAQITGTIQSSKLIASCTVNVTESDSEAFGYTISFDTRNHGTAPKPYTNVQYGSKIKAPSEPQAYGYIFTGWYKDISCQNPWNFETDVVKSDMTLYAGWIISDDTADDDSLDGVLPGDIPAGGIPDGLWIAGIKDYVYTGSPIKPQIRVYDSDKRLIAGQDYTIAYKNNTKVNNALDIKKAPTVVVKGKGNYAGTQTATFQILKADLSNDNVIAENMIIAFNNKMQKKVPTLMYHGKKLANKKDFLVSYPNGGANAYMAPGTYDIVLSAAPQGNFTGKRTVKMTITSNAGTGNAAGSSISNAVISGITDKVYTGTVPEQNVVIVMNGKNLKEGVDYRIDYSDTIQAGTVNLFITGINAYTGTVKKSFKILPYDISQDSGNQIGGLQKTVTAKYVKGGSKPKLKLTFGGKQMTEGTDYTVTYKNNKALGGNSSYTIKGKGNFKGTLTRNFTIVQKSLDDVQSPVCVIVPDMVYSNKAGKCISKPILTDTDGKKLVAGKDYIVGSYTLEDGTALTAQSIVGVNEKVQVEITGIGAYTGTVKAVYRITLQDFSKAKVSILNKAYTGKEITLGKNDISVRIGNAGLIYGTDYEIVEGSYVNNVKKGTAAVTIAGKGNYGGTKTVKFKITARKFLWDDWGKKIILSSGSCGDNVTYVLDSDGVLTISGNGDMYNYNYISHAPWYEKRTLVKKIIVDNGVTSIGESAFEYCSNLISVSISDSVTEIGYSAFEYCSFLKSVNIPESVIYIGNVAFSGCSSLTSVNIPKSITSIGASVFSECSSLTSVSIPESVTSIGNYAFSNCSNLSSVSIPKSVISIGEWAFEECSSLTSISIPESVISIGDYAFNGCINLTSAGSIGGGYDYEFGWKKNIPSNAFNGCGGLTSVNIPESVTNIGDAVFNGCDSLTNVIIPESVKSIGNFAFNGCGRLTSVNIPKSVISIGNYAFCGCSSLKDIKVLNSKCSIYDESTTIPADTVIYGYANSTAQSYAKKYNRKFVSLGTKSEGVYTY